jgi:hypothetical protein
VCLEKVQQSFAESVRQPRESAHLHSDAEITTGQGNVPAVSLVVIEPATLPATILIVTLYQESH